MKDAYEYHEWLKEQIKKYKESQNEDKMRE